MATLYTGLAEGLQSNLRSNENPLSEGGRIFIGHVLGVIKDETSPGYDGITSIGAIRVRDVLSQYNVAEGSISKFAHPLDRTNYRLPFPGEQVVCVRAFGVNVFGKFVGQSFYLGVVTAATNVVNNIMPFLGTDASHINPRALFPNPDVQSKRFEKLIDHRLDVVNKKQGIEKLREGDKVLEGRFGGVLKFSSTINKVSQPFNNAQSLDGDPIVVLKNNRKESDGLKFVDDNVDTDDVSLYLTTTQIVELDLACSPNMKSWNIDITTGETKSSKDDPSVSYQKIVDVTKPIKDEYAI